MRRRFGRGRRGSRSGAEAARSSIDAAHWLGRLCEEQIVPAAELAPLEGADAPDTFAVLGRGQDAEGRALLVGFAPRSGGDAVLATLAAARRLATDEGFGGEALAVAPQWDGAARARLRVVGQQPFGFRALAASSLDEAGATVLPDPVGAPQPVPPERVADTLEGAEMRGLFLRALAAFEGLAAKHGGAVRGTPAGVELVLMARRSAVLRAQGGRVLLETLEPERSTATLESGALAAALDRLEGQLRRRLNDRRVRASEEGLRSRALAASAEALGLRAWLAWPGISSDGEVLDLAGLDAGGRPVLAALRQRMGLPELGAVLDAAQSIHPALPLLFATAPAPVRLDAPRLALVAGEFAPATLHALAALTLDHVLYDLSERRNGEAEVSLRGEGAGAPRMPSRPAPRREEAREARRETPPEQRREPAQAQRSESRREREAPRRESPRAEGRGPERAGPAAEAESASGFEDLSLFDLEDDARGGDEREEEGSARRGRRRRGGRRRGRRSGGSDGGESRRPEPRAAEAPASEEGEMPGGDEEDDLDSLLADADLDPSATLAPFPEDVSEVEEEPAGYDEEEEESEEAGEEAGEEDWARERDLRRRARLAKANPEPEPVEVPKRPRRRTAIVVHGDRDSVAAGVLLARDIRMVEGFWVYPQEDLMTFFRSVATDLRPDTPIVLVGFTARPARDAIQAASLYAGRISWYDHHGWPPEDLESLRQAIGPENVGIEPGSGSSLPAVLSDRSRRSRFSDKLVELFTGRFSQHDYERWGQLWWHRLGEVARSSGERRNALDALLVGRPSELAREASRAGPPPVPTEVGFVAERDFRVVHFGGFTLVVVPVPEGLDLHLVARVARERFAAQLSLAHPEEGELVVLGADETRGRGGLDLGAMVSHLASKHEWVEALRDEDHVARLRVRDLSQRPERLDEVISEIGMGRSLLEG